MRDHEKYSWLEFQHARMASLQQQLLTTRDNINKATLNMPGVESLDILKKREATLLDKIAEIKLEPIVPFKPLDPEYSFVGVVADFACDICRSTIKMGVPRYHCTEKKNYDICAVCYPTANHPHPTYLEKYDNGAHHNRISRGNSVAECVSIAFQCFLKRPCIGLKRNNEIEWITYETVYNKATNFAAGLCEKFSLNPKDMVAIHSRNSVEWVCTDMGCLMTGLVVVPIHHVERDKSALAYIINNCNIKVICCETESADLFKQLQATRCPNLQQIVIYTPSETAPAISDWMGLHSFQDIEEFGKGKFVVRPVQPADIISIIHTSGSTGKPKGAPFTDKLYRNDLVTGFATSDPLVSICFEPLAHVSEREFMHNVIMSGGRVGMVNVSDSLVEDIERVGPCSMSSTPRFWNVLHSKYQQVLYFERLVQNTRDPEEVKQEVLAKFKTILGPRITSVGCGGAAPSQQLLEFLAECFGKFTVSDGYGSTEAGSIAGAGGYLATGVQIKLVDVPELGYLTTDTPFPRGELWVKTATLVNGYYNNEEDTAKHFVDGWFCTGDIVELLEPRRIKIIDRKKNFFKLSQGEFVAAQKLENKYVNSPLIDQIFITCGDILQYEQTSVFAVIVPHVNLVEKWASQNGITWTDAKDLCDNPKVVDLIKNSLLEVGKEADLAPYEIPENIILEHETFTVENGKMTSSNKLARPILERFYKDAVNKKLEEVSNAKNENTLWKILSDIFGGQLNRDSADSKKSLSDIGGDSLSAVRLSSVLQKTLNLEIPPHVLLDKSTTLETITNLIANKNQVQTVNQSLLDEITHDLELISSLTPAGSDKIDRQEISSILVTGATGFVGAHLVQHLLCTTKASVTCLVRAKDGVTPFDRLKQTLLEFRIWESLGDRVGRLHVVNADLGAEPRLGMDEASYNSLRQTTDMVFHSGAVVNHALPYGSMRKENVIGTKQIIEFCVNASKKPRLNFVSTISCIPNVPASASKQAMLLYVSTRMGGYEQSKFVSEKLVDKALQSKLVTGSIMRLGMIGWNTDSGVGNPNDWLFYLFRGIKHVGIAPDSSAEFEVLPVNIVCEILASLGFADYSIGSTIDICSNKLVPFRNLANLLGVELVPFQQWTQRLFAQIENLEGKNKNALQGLMMFSDGLPDDRKHIKEIERLSGFVASKFQGIGHEYTSGEIEKYSKFIQDKVSKDVMST